MKRMLALLLVALMAFGCVAYAADGEEETEAIVNDEEVQELLSEYPLDPANEYFGLCLPITSSEYYKGVEEELTKYCEEFGIKYDLAVAENDSQKQMSQFENFMSMGCTTIIIYATDLEAMSDIMEQARDEGIRVVSATMTPGNIDAYDIAVDASQEAVGTMAAQWGAEWVEENYPDAEDGSVPCVLFTMSNSENTIERCDAFYKIEDFTSKVSIVDVYDVPLDDYLVKCQELAELMVQEHPDVKLIITYSDIFNIIIDEVMMSDPDIDPTQVCSIAIDKTNAAMEKIVESETNESTIRATVASGENFNYTLIEAALGAFDDELNDKKQYFVEPFVINAENVDEFLTEE